MSRTKELIPNHVAIILDGNRRWAKLRGLSVMRGHYYGLYKALWPVVLDAPNQDINNLTVWGFSTENWKRDPKEIQYLFKLFERGIRNRVNELNHAGIRIKAIGQIERFPKALQKTLNDAIDKTKDNTGMTFTLALSYGGRSEIVSAAKKLAKKKPAEITEASFTKALYDPELPDVDLIIRTSGERRMSGFMPWQGTYAELYFSQKNWPDFRPTDLAAALTDFAARQRRYGS
ncbi:di-trans,poly-cis-decaprenylcistransferase [Patescibacteria group bacterium]|nr:di-trans,poly-cis-decaprenylcistransferase [Patescibacteria group bacterium]